MIFELFKHCVGFLCVCQCDFYIANTEVDNAQENVRRICAQIKEVQDKLKSERNRLQMYSTK